MYRKLYLGGLFVYAAFMVMAIAYYMERILFLDCSFAIFHIIKDGDFAIQLYRFGDGISRILPFCAVKLGLPLATVTLSYSVGNIAVYLACYLLCGSLFKQYRLALVVLLINVLFAADSYYWPTAQMPQAMALALVLLAGFWHKKTSTIRMGEATVMILLLITIVFFHPLMLIAYAYIVGFFALRGHDGPNRRLLYISGLLFMAILIVKTIFFSTEYDGTSVGKMANFVRLFPDYFNTFANRMFIAGLLSKYYWIPVIFVAVAAHYIKSKERKMLLLFSAATVGYLFLINTSFPNDDTSRFYHEALYLPIALFLGLPLVFDLLPAIPPRYAMGLVLLIMVTGVGRIFAYHTIYTQRLNWERAFLEKHGGKKMIADSHKTDVACLQMLWGTPYEFWLLSSIEQGTAASIIIDNKPHDREWAREHTRSFIVNWNIYEYEELQSPYFKFTDTTSGYLIDPPLNKKWPVSMTGHFAIVICQCSAT